MALALLLGSSAAIPKAAAQSADSSAAPALSRQLTSLKQAAERAQPDYRPRLLLESITVQGIVVNPVIEAADAAYLGIQDVNDPKSGLLLIFSGENKQYQGAAAELRAGSLIEVTGTVNLHAGQAVLKPSSLRQIGSATSPLPQVVKPMEAARFAWLGLILSVEGTVGDYREAASGEILEFSEGTESIRVFLPATPGRNQRPLSAFHRGDRIRVRGLATQFCLSPPYNRFFQLLAANANEVELVETGPALPPQIVPAAVIVILLAMLGAWYVQQRGQRQNRQVGQLLEATESLYGSGSPREVAEAIRTALEPLLAIEQVQLYTYDESRKVLEKIADSSPASGLVFAPHSFHVEEGKGQREERMALAVTHKTMSQISDAKAGNTSDSSLVLVPMLAGPQLSGLLLLSSKPGRIPVEEALKGAVQHLANAAAHQLNLIEAVSMRDQIHRGEKLSVAGQLIHGVVTELNAPLEKIRVLSAEMPSGVSASIQEEVLRASETVRRIVSVARSEQMDARPVDLRVVLQRLVQRLAQSVEGTDVELESNLAPEPLYVLGSAQQLDQVFANLFAHALAAAAHSLEQFVSVSLNRIGRSAWVEIQFSGPFGENEGPDFSREALGMAISRGLLQSHGGDLRFRLERAGRFCYEAELPSLATAASESSEESNDVATSGGKTTALLVEPELQTQRRLLALFGENGNRLIPVASIEEASELVEKLRFDVVFSCSRPEGGTWVELFHRVHHRTMHFVLLSEGTLDADESGVAELIDGRSASVLAKPIQEEEIQRLLEKLQAFRDG